MKVSDFLDPNTKFAKEMVHGLENDPFVKVWELSLFKLFIYFFRSNM